MGCDIMLACFPLDWSAVQDLRAYSLAVLTESLNLHGSDPFRVTVMASLRTQALPLIQRALTLEITTKLVLFKCTGGIKNTGSQITAICCASLPLMSASISFLLFLWKKFKGLEGRGNCCKVTLCSIGLPYRRQYIRLFQMLQKLAHSLPLALFRPCTYTPAYIHTQMYMNVCSRCKFLLKYFGKMFL